MFASLGPAGLRLPLLGSRGDDKKHPRRHETRHQLVDEQPRLGIGPVKVLDDNDDRFEAACLEDHPGNGFDHDAEALGRIHAGPRRRLVRDLQDLEDRRQPVVPRYAQ